MIPVLGLMFPCEEKYAKPKDQMLGVHVKLRVCLCVKGPARLARSSLAASVTRVMMVGVSACGPCAWSW